jgi:hypothetical protein
MRPRFLGFFLPGPARAGCLAAVLAPALPAAPLAVEKVVGPETCVECHVDQLQVWKQTKHHKTFRQLPPRPETAAMLVKLGLEKVKGEKQCQDCHFTGQLIDEQYQTVSGISCESCHGAAADWAKTHGDYGHGVTVDKEPPAHRAERQARADAAGMLGPRRLHAIANTCYECHILTDEKIVNLGGHPAGSPGFNLVAWSQGEVRHSVPREGDKINPEAPLPRRRLMFVLGAILETEHCVRAVAAATERADFALTQARRGDTARQLLEKIHALAPLPELGEIVAAAKAARLRLNNRAELLAAADRLARLGRTFGERVTGDQLAALDPLLPAPDQYKGTPHRFPGVP